MSSIPRLLRVLERAARIGGPGALLLALPACSDYGISQGTDPSVNPLTDGDAHVVDDSHLPIESPETPRDAADAADRVVQPATFEVDVLWVVDNSCSMEDDQTSLVNAFPVFVDYFLALQGIDYHIGVVSTDVVDGNHNGQLRQANGVRWLETDTPDPYGTFTSMAGMGTSGSGDEAGRAAAFQALSTHADTTNAGFVREDAPLSIIVISDEDDSSSMFGVDLDPFVGFLDGLKYDPELVTFSAIAGPTPSGCPTADPGFDYAEVQSRTGGVFYSICAADWTVVLDALAQDAAARRREFFLTDIPDPDSIDVWVVEPDGSTTAFVLGTDYTYNAIRNSIQFVSYMPGPYAEVFISYDVDWGATP